MVKRPKKTQKSQTKLKGFVIAAVVKDTEQAKEYAALLKTNDIPAVIKEQNEPRLTRTEGFAVMVPEGFIDEACAIIESQDAYGDFCNFALKNGDNNDFDSDLFEDDF